MLPEQERIAKQEAIRKSKTPSWQDLKSEGVIDHVPDPGPDGKVNVKVVGPERNRRLMKMLRERYMADVDYCDGLREKAPRRLLRDRTGRERWVREDRLEAAEKRHGTTRKTFYFPRDPG